MYLSPFSVIKMGKSPFMQFYASFVEGENNSIVGDEFFQ